MGKRVWILGAGFSKPLGGPLLDDLLRPEVMANLAASYPGKYEPLHEVINEAVLWTYWYGRQFRSKLGHWHRLGDVGEQLWDDAEQFLDYIDTALRYEQSTASTRIREIASRYYGIFHTGGAPKNLLSALASAARRLVAASCCLFVHATDVETERWTPFVDWAKRLTAEDVVVTFNYDCVLDLLNKATRTMHHGTKSELITGPCAIFKLHGSVNWRLEPPSKEDRGNLNASAKYSIENDFEYALHCPSENLAIASPGPSKRELSDYYAGEWIGAMDAIKCAGAVIFVGYRFPPSDADSRRKILEALRANTEQYLAVHTVLGPRLDDDTERLRQMLEATVYSRARRRDREGRESLDAVEAREKWANVIVHRLWAQDFLPMYESGLLNQAYRLHRRTS